MDFPERLYHAAPLHYLPHILRDGALYAQSVLAASGIRPRATAFRRDRMLGLADYVHLSLDSRTPLLLDKLRRGYPHSLLVFPAAQVLAQPEVALLPGNTKSWRSRAALAPVADPAERDALWRRHAATGRFPSMEVLVKYGLSLEPLERLIFYTGEEHALVSGLLNALSIPPAASMTVEPDRFPLCPDYQPTTLGQAADYFAACRAAGRLLSPPAIPFD